MSILLRPGVSENKSLSRYNSRHTRHHWRIITMQTPGSWGLLWSEYGGNTVCDVRIMCRETRSSEKVSSSSVLWCLWYCGTHNLYKVHLVRLVHFVIENIDLNVFLLYYWHTTDNSMMRWCNYRVSLFTKYDFIEQWFIFVLTWADRRLGQSDQQCCHQPG